MFFKSRKIKGVLIIYIMRYTSTYNYVSHQDSCLHVQLYHYDTYRVEEWFW